MAVPNGKIWSGCFSSPTTMALLNSPPRRSSARSEQLTRDTDAILKEAMQLPGLLDEAEALSKSFQSLHEKGPSSRSKRGAERAAKR